ncbi:alpha-1,2-fucosyltransferase [Bacteroidia bacterium]|nr:alpha-1,2-fucosyltransferase [Bacteroidia bacterium]GHT04642.1 alpha-1,2-fucosyltransferase [Bacteroidia bacterium]
MEIIVFSGGLGNQLFQYAFYWMKKKTAADVEMNTYSIGREGLHNGFELERLFGIKSGNTSQIVRLVRKILIFQKKKHFKIPSALLLNLVKLTGVKIIQEQGYSRFNPDYLKQRKGSVIYFGFWQSPLYFDAFQKEIRKVFSFDKLQLSGKSNALVTTIRSTESVSVHIRRGDFLAKDNKNINVPCDKAYYEKAISLITGKIKNPLFVFFSDDLDWVKENISLSNAVYVDWNSGINSWQDMYLMSECKHNIIANSTFSWWGAWLNANKEKTVIAPAKFVNNVETPDIYPENWIIVE